METLPTILLKPGEANRLLAGHPWIYRGSILRLTREAEDGAIVQVKDHRQRFIAVGFYNSQSKISVRIIATERVDVDTEFFRRRITNAWKVRKKHMPGATSFRVVNSESDSLSGLIVDKYEDVLVVQFSSLGMDCRKRMIVPILEELFEPRAIVERSDMASRKFEGLEPSVGNLAGCCDEVVDMRMNGLDLKVDLRGGHKTGAYLDQQINYQLVADLAVKLGAKSALDCFCFQGGFALHLAKAGVASIHALDQSEEAIRNSTRSAKRNGCETRCSFAVANVFDWLKQETTVPKNERVIPKFDLIVLDPPSFTRNKATVPDALRGYKEIHLRALKLLKPGGSLTTFCCSHHVDDELFQEVILAAAFDARKVIREIGRFVQAPDHPVIPSIPETKYLKGYALELV